MLAIEIYRKFPKKKRKKRAYVTVMLSGSKKFNLILRVISVPLKRACLGCGDEFTHYANRMPNYSQIAWDPFGMPVGHM